MKKHTQQHVTKAASGNEKNTPSNTLLRLRLAMGKPTQQHITQALSGNGKNNPATHY